MERLENITMKNTVKEMTEALKAIKPEKFRHEKDQKNYAKLLAMLETGKLKKADIFKELTLVNGILNNDSAELMQETAKKLAEMGKKSTGKSKKPQSHKSPAESKKTPVPSLKKPAPKKEAPKKEAPKKPATPKKPAPQKSFVYNGYDFKLTKKFDLEKFKSDELVIVNPDIYEKLKDCDMGYNPICPEINEAINDSTFPYGYDILMNGLETEFSVYVQSMITESVMQLRLDMLEDKNNGLLFYTVTEREVRKEK